jgi:hypothetical protein
MRVAVGIGALGHDAANSIEELIKAAAQRMGQATPAAAAPLPKPQAVAMPPELEKAIALLERVDPQRHAPIVAMVARRLAAIMEKLKGK